MAKSRGTKIQPLHTHWKELSKAGFNTVMSDFKKYTADTIIINNKNGKAVPMILNEAQEAVADLLLPLIFNPIPSPVSVVIHKFRQGGISTLISALEKYVLSKKKNISSVHLFPTDKLAKEFFEKKFLPLMQGSHPSTLPLSSYTTSPNPVVRFESFLGQRLETYLSIGGALSQGAGRSGTNNIAVFDEYAFYEKVTQLEKGILFTMPNAGFSLTIYVSTSNGINHFYDVIENAKKPDSAMQYLFLAWHMMKENEATPTGRLANLNNLQLTTYEKFLLEVFEQAGYPPDTWLRKVQFYNDKLDRDAKGDQTFMFSEYPTIPEESFEATGRPVFPTKILLEALDKAYHVPYKMVEPSISEHAGRKSIIFEEVIKSGVHIFKEPVYGKRYIIGVDPSLGYEDGDFLEGVVLDYETMEEVCTFKDKVEQSEFAELACNIGKYYNYAMIVPERNMGTSFIEWLRLLNYSRVYIDPTSNRSKPMFGIHMTRPVKREAINRFRFLLINKIYKPNSVQFLKDALHFVWKTTQSGMYQKAEASGTDENKVPYHDDSIMARLTLVAALDMRRWSKYATTENRRQV